MKNLIIFLVVIGVAACVSNPPIDRDPSERIIYGTVLMKENLKDLDEMEREKREAQAENTQFIVQQANTIGAGAGETIAAIIILNMLGLEPPGGYGVKGDPIAYTVRTRTNQLYKVISYYTGFSAGDCVKLFISNDFDKYPPRVAYGNSCSDRS